MATNDSAYSLIGSQSAVSAVSAWRVTFLGTGITSAIELRRKGRRGRKPTVETIHERVTKAVARPAPRNSVRFMLDGTETAVLAGGAKRVPFDERIEQHRELLRKRGRPTSAEVIPPTGQAAAWYADVIRCVPRSGQMVARQIARLCGIDSQVTVPVRSLVDAVGRRDSAGRDSAYTRRGIECLVSAGWLRSETSGSGQNIITTFYLHPGDRFTEWVIEDDQEWEQDKLSD